jgi:hypothetical protein
MRDIRPQDWRPLTLRRINLVKAKDRDGLVILLDTDIPSNEKQRSDGRRSEFEVDGRTNSQNTGDRRAVLSDRTCLWGLPSPDVPGARNRFSTNQRGVRRNPCV